MNYKRICITCGNPYFYNYRNKKQSANYCSQNCIDVFDLASDICFGIVSDEKANERLKKLDTTYIKDKYKDIFIKIKPVTTSKKKAVKETETIDE